MANRQVAYFTMEIALENRLPTYCGGLGVLAGDTIRSMADLGVPAVAVTLLHRKGYFHQKIDDIGTQTEHSVPWEVEEILTPVDASTVVEIEGRTVHVRVWKYSAIGVNGHEIPVYFLDTDVPSNSDEDRRITDHLYQGDNRYRLTQEVVLGVGGVRILNAIGHENVHTIHLNEGHAALATLESLAQAQNEGLKKADAIARTKDRFVFTTHTPVPAGHDRFDHALAKKVLSSAQMRALESLETPHGSLDMSLIALALSRYANGVALRHGEVSREMFPQYEIDSITNGIHSPSWVSDPFQNLFDKYIPRWRADSYEFRNAAAIPDGELWEAHLGAKKLLSERIRERTGRTLNPDVFTLGFARRVVGYKRASLIFQNPERLRAIAKKHGPIQLVFAGKAHPNDPDGKGYLKTIFGKQADVAPDVEVIYIPDYDLEIGLAITTGVDVWLNNPIPPREASGTSGMKSAHNGVPSLSILDGWWCEGHVEGVTGWAIGDADDYKVPRNDDRDAESIYDQLDQAILPLFHKDREGWTQIMRNAIALNAPYFNTHRMVQEYIQKAYLPRELV
ncbi:MAG: alpha-glucan family phosphorylase [Myxococcales bacterium]|nr:alpha-glucan family phosphorylase [Myxococcales bacterium]